MRVLIAIKGCEFIEPFEHNSSWARAEFLLPPFRLLGYFTGKILNVPDDYDHLPQKTKAICEQLKTTTSVFLCDTDTFVSTSPAFWLPASSNTTT